MQELSAPQGRFTLGRYPLVKGDTLRAWDAADELVLRHLAGDDATAPVGLDGDVLVVNDGSGALATALAASHPTSWSDSYLSHVATTENLERNRLDAAGVALLPSTAPPPGHADVVIVKIPKSLALLESQLIAIAPTLTADSVVIGAAMTKHVHRSTLELFERIIGPTHTSLAQKKARLIFSAPDVSLPRPVAPWPTRFSAGNAGLTIVNEAGVFSSERLDIGTRFLLDHLPKSLDGDQVVDLGCGNGVLGLVAAIRFPDAAVTFVDESYLAVASAEATYQANIDDDRNARFVAGDGLRRLASDPAIDPGSIDLVLNNPPFHDNHAEGDATAWRMFTDAHAALRPGGELWVVGNRHLAYHAKLKRIFGNCDVRSSNAKFVVFRATR